MKTDYTQVDFGVYNTDNISSGVDIKKITAAMTGKSGLKDDPETVAENARLIEVCRADWDALGDFRDRRRRNRLYYRGDQWHEVITDPDTGLSSTEEDYIKRLGKIPFKQNIIRQVMKNLLGQYRTNPTKSMVLSRKFGKGLEAEMLTNALQNSLDINKADELDVRNYEEFLVSGASVGKVRYNYWKERNTEDVYIENVNPNRIFFNAGAYDIRLKELHRVGEIIDTTLDEVIASFAKTDQDEQKIKSWYTTTERYPQTAGDTLTADRMTNIDFFIPYDTDMCRVIEVWYLKSEWRTYAHDTLDGTYNIVDMTIKDIERENAMRIAQAAQYNIPAEKVPVIHARRKYEQFWVCKYLTPTGQTLWEGETMYLHESHPYVILLYPLLDGEVWGFIEDIIDQQRYINRLISLQDFIMGASAKGVLLVPEEVIPDDMTLDDFAEEWSKFNGVIKIKMKPGATIPQQIASKSTVPGLFEMISLQMKMLQDIGGANSAMQGQTPQSGTPAALYAMQIQNSAINTRDYMDTFGYYKEQRDLKVLQLIRQYYNDKRYLLVSGSAYGDEAAVYDPERVRDLECDLKVIQSTETPIYRSVIDNLLFQLLQGGMINLKMFLENTSLPFAERLLEQIKVQEQQMQQAAQQGGMPPAGLPPEMMAQAQAEMQQQAGGQSNPQAAEVMNRLMGA